MLFTPEQLKAEYANTKRMSDYAIREINQLLSSAVLQLHDVDVLEDIRIPAPLVHKLSPNDRTEIDKIWEIEQIRDFGGDGSLIEYSFSEKKES